jgi:hypothetical protein
MLADAALRRVALRVDALIGRGSGGRAGWLRRAASVEDGTRPVGPDLLGSRCLDRRRTLDTARMAG